MAGEDDVRVIDNPTEERYELLLDGKVAGFIAYRLEPDAVVLIHTDVDAAFEGRGFGSRLVAGALDDIRARGLSVVPVCRFVASYLRRHPVYADLVERDRAPGP